MGCPGPNQDIVVKDNYFIGGFQPVVISDWASAVFQANTIYTDEYLMAFATANPAAGYTWTAITTISGGQGWTGFDLHRRLAHMRQPGPGHLSNQTNRSGTG